MAGVRALQPAAQVQEALYDLKVMKTPTLSGTPLRLFIAALEGPLFHAVAPSIFRMNNYPQVLSEVFLPELPTYRPNTQGWPAEAGELLALSGSPAERAAAAARTLPGFGKGAKGVCSAGGPRRRRIADFYQAYRSGEATPAQVAENVIAAVKDSEQRDPPMSFFVAWDPEHIRQQAAASTRRYAAGAPLSPLDGVPFAVKDCVDALLYPTTCGTGFMAEWRPVPRTNPAVQSLLDAGAILVGKTTMHEIGLGTTGLNTVTGTARNPHDPWRHTGGSSSGTGALLAAGVVPIGVGTDGGGSIRIPAGLCGVVGLKPTHDRVCAEGGPPIDQTVSVIGPMAGCVEDCLLMYSLMANVGHSPGSEPPPLRLPRSLASAGAQPLRGKRAGVYWTWFEDGDPALVKVCKDAVTALEELGLEVESVNVPELEALRVAHTCTILCEMRNNMQGALINSATRCKFNLESRATLAVGRGLSAADYIQAQKVRTRAEVYYRRLFDERGLHYIITPTLPALAPPIPPAALASGISDIATTTLLMRYMLAPNMLGFPAISVPVGSVPAVPAPGGGGDRRSAAAGGSAATVTLPVGLQLVAPPWQEASLLGAAAALARALGEGATPEPQVLYDVLRPAENAAAGAAQ